MEPTNLQKAIAVANKASQEDQAGNYEEAVKSYQHAVKYFLHVVKREPQGKDGNQKIREKCKQYLDRAEELQDYLEKREGCHSQASHLSKSLFREVDMSVESVDDIKSTH